MDVLPNDMFVNTKVGCPDPTREFENIILKLGSSLESRSKVREVVRFSPKVLSGLERRERGREYCMRVYLSSSNIEPDPPKGLWLISLK